MVIEGIAYPQGVRRGALKYQWVASTLEAPLKAPDAVVAPSYEASDTEID